MKTSLYDAEDDTSLVAEWEKKCYGVNLYFKGCLDDKDTYGIVSKDILYRFCKQFISKIDKEKGVK